MINGLRHLIILFIFVKRSAVPEKEHEINKVTRKRSSMNHNRIPIEIDSEL